MMRPIFLLLVVSLCAANDVFGQERSDWLSSLQFHASFDQSADADVAKGDAKIYTAENLKREKLTAGLDTGAVSWEKDTGKWGGCLKFHDVQEKVVLYQAKQNFPYRTDGFDATISFWLKVDPEKGLKPGYVDPLQITDKAWNDASLFVDFTKDETPRHFRLGVFSDYAHWNSSDTNWDDIAESDRPMVTVKKTPFSGDRWTHVAIVLSGIRSGHSHATLYLNGKNQGMLDSDLKLTWQLENVAMMLGIQYIGRIDDFAIFSKALTDEQVSQLYGLPNGVAGK
ncbi:MAG: LamG-like jellyroll fold domain-containing protein [Pirellulaceae bacterium]